MITCIINIFFWGGVSSNPSYLDQIYEYKLICASVFTLFVKVQRLMEPSIELKLVITQLLFEMIRMRAKAQSAGLVLSGNLISPRDAMASFLSR